MTISFDDITVSTVGRIKGRYWWRARTDDRAVEFIAKRTANVTVLYRRARKALRRP